jgi:hypothetical protein
MIYKSKEKELASLQEELCAKKKAVKETQCSFKYQIQSDLINSNLDKYRELFVEIVNYVLKFLSFRVQVIWNFIFVVLLQDKYVIIYCSLSKGPATCGHECIQIFVQHKPRSNFS